MRWARFLRCDVDAGFGMTYELVAKKRRKSATNRPTPPRRQARHRGRGIEHRLEKSKVTTAAGTPITQRRISLAIFPLAHLHLPALSIPTHQFCGH